MFLKSFFVCGAVCICAAAASAQTAKPEIKLGQVEMTVDSQFTPQIQVTNVKDKRWRPKQWLELQVDFKATIARSLGGREGTYPSIDIRYYLALAGKKTSEGKQVVMSGTITYKDVVNGENHALAFITPSSLKRLLEKENGGKADVSVFACEIVAGGEVIAGKSTGPGKWWEATDKISFEEVIVPKEKTPFAPLWGDFDLVTGK